MRTSIARLIAVFGLLIGALAFGMPASAATVSVTTCNDSGSGSLRAAIGTAAAGDTITFATDCPASAPIRLTTGTLTLSKGVTIDGTGHTVIVDGNNAVTVFTLNSGVTAAISGLTIQHGSATGNGGGIYMMFAASLTVTNVTIAGNTALSGNGAAGIVVDRGTLNVRSSTIANNTGGNIGGGIANLGGTVAVTNSTISGNSSGSAGGINNSGGTLTVTSSTLAGNTATFSGGAGGILTTGQPFPFPGNTGGVVTLTNTIVATSTGGDLGAFAGGSFTGNNNLIDDATSAGGFTDNAGGNIVGHPALLGTLGDYGGPTQTMPPLPGSPAIDAGGGGCSGTDQRGVARPQGAACDIGAVEVAALLVPTLTGATPATTPLVASDAADLPVTLTGTNFSPDGSSVAVLAGTPLATTYNPGDGTLTAQIPAGLRATAGAYQLTVRNGTTAAGISNALTFTVTNPAPTLTGLSPTGVTAGAGDTALTLTGTGFAPGATINFGGTVLTPTSASATGLTVVVPAALLADARTVAVTVTNPGPGGGVSALQAFTVAAPAPAPAPAQAVVTASASGNGTVTPAGSTSYATGSQATYAATAAAGQTFVGWTLDGVYVGYASPLTFTVNANRTLVATFVATPRFSDLGGLSASEQQQITFLAALGIVNPNGVNGSGQFQPNADVKRAEVAAFVARVFGWQHEFHANNFPDKCDANGQNCVDDELWNNVAALKDYGVVGGYADQATCQSAGTTTPCYLPRDVVKRIQVVSVVARAFIKTPDLRPTGFWDRLNADNAQYTNVPNTGTQRSDLTTYRANVGTVPGQTSDASFGDPSGNGTRLYVIQVLYAAFNAQFGVDRVP